MTIISKQLGLRADEAGATAASASPVTFTSATSFRASGIINSRDDVDWWRIDVMGPGSLKVNVEPWRSSVYTEGSDLDVSIKLVSSAGSTVASANPSTSFGATLTVTVSAGTYYLAVDGVGRKGHYSDYASMGQYDISGTVPSGAVPSTTTKAATTATTTKVETTTQTTTTKAATTTTTLQPGEVQYTTGCKCSGACKARSEAKTVGLDANGLLRFCLHKKNSGGQIAGKVSLIESSGAYSTRFTTPQLSKLHDTLCVMYRPLAGEDEGSTKYRIKRKSTSGGRGKIRWDLK